MAKSSPQILNNLIPIAGLGGTYLMTATNAYQVDISLLALANTFKSKFR
jgi:hypothetical protein